MNIKKLLISLVTFLLLFTTAAYASNRYISLTLTYDYQSHKYNAEEVFVAIDGTKLTDLSMPPIILNDYTLVPAREVFEAIGATVDWKKDIEQVYITYNDTLIVIPVNSQKAYVNGQSKTLDTEAKIINNKTMIPLRFVTTALGFEIQWDSNTRIANIITKSVSETTTVTTETTTETTTITTQATTLAATEPTTETAQSGIQQMSFTSSNNGRNISYDYENDILYIKNTAKINLNAIKEQDNYSSRNYTIEIEGNLSASIPSVTFEPDSEKVKSCAVTVAPDKTTIVFNENRILAMDINQYEGWLSFKTLLPKEKYSKIVVIDAGHGGDAPGAIANNLQEKDLTLKMALSAQEKFEQNSSVKCYMTRTTDTNPSFDARTSLANEVGDAFISIHINSATSSEAHGTETFCQYANDLGNGLTSYRVAEEMLDQLLNKLGTTNRNVKTNDLKVLRDSSIPASLIEIGFISNANEANIMSNSIDLVGQAVYDGIINLFDKYPPVR